MKPQMFEEIFNTTKQTELIGTQVLKNPQQIPLDPMQCMYIKKQLHSAAPSWNQLNYL